MAVYLEDVSRTFGEYLLIPGLTTKACIPTNVSLKTPLVKHAVGEPSPIRLNIPFVSAIMQAVSGPELAIELARNGGLSFIFGSQPIESQAEMVRKVKKFKAGFVVSDSNLTPEQTLADVVKLVRQTGHSTIGITDDGTPNGRLLGIVTSRDYRAEKDDPAMKIGTFMTPFSKLIYGRSGISLSEANRILWEHKLNSLPIIDADDRLAYFVFRKDYDSHRKNPDELSDATKKLLVGAGINTRDYKERVPALIEAGVDALCIDSSDGYSEWQQETLEWVKSNYHIPVGAGNIVDSEGFRYLVDAGADFIKVGIGGGSLSVPFMMYCRVPVHQAVATSSVLAWPIAVSGALGYLFSGWNVPGLPAGAVGFWYVPCIVVLGACTVLFAPLGVKAAHRLPPAGLKRAFGVLMVVIGSQMLWKLLHGA